MKIPNLEASLRPFTVTEENVKLWLEHNEQTGRRFGSNKFGNSKYENPYHQEWNNATNIELIFWTYGQDVEVDDTVLNVVGKRNP